MQRIKLDINPKGEIPVLHVAQYDNGRLFAIELVEGENAYNVPSGYSVQLNVRKTDSKLVTAAPDSIVDNILNFSTTEQMTACPGENIASITLKDTDNVVITTLYFLISVQRDVLAGGLDSASEIHNLEEQIAAIVPEVIGEDYYNKTDTDALLSDKADKSELPDMTDYYTKTQTDNLLNDKADRTDLATLASKAELTQAISDEDTALKNWVSSNFATSGYVATHYYTKLQVDGIIDNMLPVGSAVGNPCTFDTAKYHTIIPALTADIVCGGGGGTPSAPIPIVGHSELNLTRCGVNLWDEEWELGIWNFHGIKEASNSAIRSKNYIAVVPNLNIYLVSPFKIIVREFDINKNLIKTITPYVSQILTLSPTTQYIVFCTYSSDNITSYSGGISFNKPSTDTEYHAYNGQTFTVAFGQTVYGGVYDKSGRLTIESDTHITLDGTENWTLKELGPNSAIFMISGFKNNVKNELNQMCSHFTFKGDAYSLEYINTFVQDESGNLFIQVDKNIADNATDFKTWLATQYANGTPVEYIYNSTNSPVVIDVPSISVFAENGTNNIISDCGGDVNVSYKDTIQHYIDQRLQ